MKEIKKIGHNVELKNIVIHRINKDAGTRLATIKLAKKSLTISDKEKSFIGSVNYNYNRSIRKPTYGVFEDGTINSFQEYLKKYLNQEITFFEFTSKSMDYYQSCLISETASTGGFILFADFLNTDKNNEFLLIITLNNKEGFNLDEENLTLNNVKNIDLNKIDVASLINLTKWTQYNKGDAEIKTYLSFVKGQKKITYYFMQFIGCKNKTTASDASKNLVKALNSYCTLKGMNSDESRILKNSVYGYCRECIDRKTEIQLSFVSSILKPEEPEDFSIFASNEDFSVNEIISGDKSVLKLIKYISYKSDNLILEFNNELLSQERIIYNREKNELLIKEIPVELSSQI